MKPNFGCKYNTNIPIYNRKKIKKVLFLTLFILIFFINIYKNPQLHSQGQTQRYNPCNNRKRNQPVQPPF